MAEKESKKHEECEDKSLDADNLLSKLAEPAKPADILIVDDVYANLFLMENILNENYSVKGVGSAEAMWRYLKVFAPRLILLDLMMPYENGFEILQRLKADPSLKKIPVIVVSAKDSREDVVKVLSLGAVDYAVKPVEEQSLLRKVRKVFGETEIPHI